MLRQEDSRFIMGEGVHVGNLCSMCAHFMKDRRCEAFPNGIPRDIYFMEVIHTKPYPGDNGILFKPLLEFDTSQIHDIV
jgi:hypothetical protein